MKDRFKRLIEDKINNCDLVLDTANLADIIIIMNAAAEANLISKENAQAVKATLRKLYMDE